MKINPQLLQEVSLHLSHQRSISLKDVRIMNLPLLMEKCKNL